MVCTAPPYNVRSGRTMKMLGPENSAGSSKPMDDLPREVLIDKPHSRAAFKLSPHTSRRWR